MKIKIYALGLLIGFFVLVTGTAVASENKNEAITLTRTPVPTRTPIWNFYEFKQASLNKVPPKDILQQISFFGGGGGVICVPGNKPNKPNITFEPSDEVLMNQSTMIACGWGKGETLKGTVVFPNGMVFNTPVKVLLNEGMYYGKLSFTPGLADPIGKYTFILEGKAGTVQDTVYFKKPSGPHLFVIDSKTIMLYGFSPREQVRLFKYSSTKLSGWQEFTMDENGQSIIKVTIGVNDYLWAVGKSGEAPMPKENQLTKGGSTYPALQRTIRQTACSDLPIRLVIMEGGRVAFTDGADMNVRSAPGTSQKIIGKVPEGSDFWVVDGPKCANGIAWWKVNMEEYNLSGWIAESFNNVYLVEPFK